MIPISEPEIRETTNLFSFLKMSIGRGHNLRPVSRKTLFGGLLVCTLAWLGWGIVAEAQADQLTSVVAETIYQENLTGETSEQPEAYSFTSEHLELTQPIEALGFTWLGDPDARFEIRYDAGWRWTEWHAVPAMEDLGAKGLTDQLATDLFFLEHSTKTFQYRVYAATRLNDVQSITLDTTANRPLSWLTKGLRRLVPSATAANQIISRAEWGADESITYWEPEYTTPKKFILHHTAGGNGGSDPAATIRGIHYWHTVALGWGDIGYNYLVDPAGRIYEGRQGGDGAIGAHAYRSGACNQQRFGGGNTGINFNLETIGVAVLGNYENEILPVPAAESISSLIAEKSALYGITPSGASDFHDLTQLPNISGHGDVDCTSCPGAQYTTVLTDIRTRAQQLYDDGTFQPSFGARTQSVSPNEFQLDAGRTTDITVEFLNTGSSTWHASDGEAIALTSVSASPSLRTESWLSANTIGRLGDEAVEPGESIRWTFSVRAPSDRLTAAEQFRLTRGGLPMPGSEFTLTATVSNLERAAELVSHSVPVATLAGHRTKITFRYKNIGTKTWTPANTVLRVADLGDRPSRYSDSTWRDQYSSIRQKESAVAPGQTATFEVYEVSPLSSGLYKQLFRLLVDSRDAVNSQLERVSRVDPRYRAELAAVDFPIAVLSAWRPTVTLRFKNTGPVAWNNDMELYVSDLGGQASRFRDTQWSNAHGRIKLKESIVRPGEIGTFQFRIKPNALGIYKNEFHLAARQFQVEGSGFERITRVD